MGCGQSKIHLYPRKSKSKANGKKGGHVDTDADADEDEGQVEEAEKDINRDKDRIDDDIDQTEEKGSPDSQNGDISVSLLRAKNLSLLQSQEISTSQQNFFRMLDKKIEDGPDYDSASETEIALEEARLNALVQHWESASLTASMCSSASRSLQSTPVRQVPIRQPPPPAIIRGGLSHSIPQQPLSADLLPPLNVITQSPGMIMVGQHSQQQLQQYQQQQQQQHQQQQQGMTSQMMGVGSVMLASGSPQSQLLAKSQQALMMGRPPVPNVAVGVGVGVGVGVTSVGQVIPPHMQLAYYGQQQSQGYFGEVLHPMQVPQGPPEYRFPPAISVQRLAPQVQRQLRETQELIKDSCPQLYAAGYGSPGPPMRNQPRNPNRRPTLETQFSQELS